ncbi:MAG: hypothetical protein E6L02_05445 [Thaumarchaeota archaeon]|nr:MAG: hypothetical protein E6L02_05445 [Nitrososphaerota archaeon]
MSYNDGGFGRSNRGYGGGRDRGYGGNRRFNDGPSQNAKIKITQVGGRFASAEIVGSSQPAAEPAA